MHKGDDTINMNAEVRTGFNWLRIGSTGWLLQAQYTAVRLHESEECYQQLSSNYTRKTMPDIANYLLSDTVVLFHLTDKYSHGYKSVNTEVVASTGHRTCAERLWDLPAFFRSSAVLIAC